MFIFEYTALVDYCLSLRQRSKFRTVISEVSEQEVCVFLQILAVCIQSRSLLQILEIEVVVLGHSQLGKRKDLYQIGLAK